MKNKYIYVLSVSFIVCFSFSTFGQWTSQSLGTNTGFFSSVAFINKDKGFALGNDFSNHGILYGTDDAGEHWNLLLTSSSNDHFSKVVFPGNNLGFIIGDSSGYARIRRTIDGGKTWSLYPAKNIEGSFDDAFFTDTKHGFIIGSNMNAYGYLTLDGGDTWKKITAPDYYDIHQVNFKDEKTGFLLGVPSSGGSALFLKTTDGGATWEFPSIPPSWASFTTFSGVVYADTATAYAFGGAGMNGKIVKTTDAGKTWKDLPTKDLSGIMLSKLVIAGSNTLYMLCSDQSFNSHVIKSNDGGMTWRYENITFGFEQFANDLFMIDSSYGFAACGNSCIQRRGVAQSSLQVFESQDPGILLYPNPVTSGKQEVTVRTAQTFRAVTRLTDQAGKLIWQSYSEQVFLKGDNKLLPYNLRLAQGTYYVQFISASQVFSKKISIQ